MIGSHYPLYLLPSIFICAGHALSRVSGSEALNLSRYMLAVTSLMILVLSPISPMSRYVNDGGQLLWYPRPFAVTEETRSTHEMLNLVPGDSAVLTQNHIFPHVSGRLNAYVIPISDFSPGQAELIDGYLDGLIDKCEYVLLDLREIDEWTSYTHGRVASNGSFGIQAFTDSVVLFMRGAETSPDTAKGLEHRVYHACREMHIGVGVAVPDSASEVGEVALSPRGSAQGFLVFGPYVYMTEGVYDVSFCLQVSQPWEGYIGTFEVTCDQGRQLLTKRDLYGYEFPSPEWREMRLLLSLDGPKELVEFRLRTKGAANVRIDRIEVNRTDLRPGATASTITFNYVDLLVDEGELTDDCLLRHLPVEDEVFWYGPYHGLPLGDYNATFYLKAIPSGTSDNGTLVTLDACYGEGRHIVGAAT